MLGQTVSLRSTLFDIALQIVLLAEEDQKPNEERLRGYTDSARESLLQGLLSTAPIYRDLEKAKLADEIWRGWWNCAVPRTTWSSKSWRAKPARAGRRTGRSDEVG